MHDAVGWMPIASGSGAVVSLRFFGGLKVEEAAEALGVSKTTVEGEWRAARAWLARELRPSI